MSKYVKNLVTDEVRTHLTGVHDALLVNVVGMDANANNRLRKELQDKKINLLVVKNGLAVRALLDTPLQGMFDGLAGPAAICWGSEDVVSLAKEVTRLAKDAKFAPFAPRGGVIDGEKIDAQQVEAVSKWPSRGEQLSLLVGQILGPGAKLAAQIIGPAGKLAGQVKSKAEGAEEESPAADAPVADAPAAEAAPSA